jgi:hypothetical protein
MGRKRFKRKHRSKTRPALLILFLFTFIALAIIAVVVRLPEWHRALIPEQTDTSVKFDGPDGSLSYGSVDASEWALSAIVFVVSLSGVSAWVILIRANR